MNNPLTMQGKSSLGQMIGTHLRGASAAVAARLVDLPPAFALAGAPAPATPPGGPRRGCLPPSALRACSRLEIGTRVRP